MYLKCTPDKRFMLDLKDGKSVSLHQFVAACCEQLHLNLFMQFCRSQFDQQQFSHLLEGHLRWSGSAASLPGVCCEQLNKLVIHALEPALIDFFGIALARVHFSQLTACTTGEFLSCVKCPGTGSSWNSQGGAGGVHRGQTHGFICLCKRSPGILCDLKETFKKFLSGSSSGFKELCCFLAQLVLLNCGDLLPIKVSLTWKALRSSLQILVGLNSYAV